MQIISITIQKGGTGKSTTSQNLAAGLLLKGYRVLLMDMDAQGNLSYSTGADKTGITILEVLLKEATITEAIQTIKGIDIVPASISLSGADMILTKMGKEYRLKEALEPVKKEYDFILIDTPPSLGILTINALTASTGVIIPAQADIYSLDAIGQLYNTIQAVKQYTNKDLVIHGILLTKYNERTILSKDMAKMIEDTAKQMHTKVYSSKVRESIVVREAQASQQDLFTYAPKSKVAEDYRVFVQEVIGG